MPRRPPNTEAAAPPPPPPLPFPPLHHPPPPRVVVVVVRWAPPSPLLRGPAPLRVRQWRRAPRWRGGPVVPVEGEGRISACTPRPGSTKHTIHACLYAYIYPLYLQERQHPDQRGDVAALGGLAAGAVGPVPIVVLRDRLVRLNPPRCRPVERPPTIFSKRPPPSPPESPAPDLVDEPRLQGRGQDVHPVQRGRELVPRLRGGVAVGRGVFEAQDAEEHVDHRLCLLYVSVCVCVCHIDSPFLVAPCQCVFCCCFVCKNVPCPPSPLPGCESRW